MVGIEPAVPGNSTKMTEPETWQSGELCTSQVSLTSLPDDEKSELTIATVSSTSIESENRTPESADAKEKYVVSTEHEKTEGNTDEDVELITEKKKVGFQDVQVPLADEKRIISDIEKNISCVTVETDVVSKFVPSSEKVETKETSEVQLEGEKITSQSVTQEIQNIRSCDNLEDVMKASYNQSISEREEIEEPLQEKQTHHEETDLKAAIDEERVVLKTEAFDESADSHLIGKNLQSECHQILGDSEKQVLSTEQEIQIFSEQKTLPQLPEPLPEIEHVQDEDNLVKPSSSSPRDEDRGSQKTITILSKICTTASVELSGKDTSLDTATIEEILDTKFPSQHRTED